MSGEVVETGAAERAEARKKRRAFASSPLSAFVRVMRKCMELYLKARGDGVSREDGVKGIEAELIAAWPKKVSRFAPACSTCDDTGWDEHICFDGHRCGRKWCHDAHPAHEHRYVIACVCPAGDKHRKRIVTVEDEIARAGRMAKKKASGFTRVGG